MDSDTKKFLPIPALIPLWVFRTILTTWKGIQEILKSDYNRFFGITIRIFGMGHLTERE